MNLFVGDCREVLGTFEAESFDACVTDPPYHLTAGKKGGSGEASVSLTTPYGRARITTGFMGQKWDGGDVAAQPETWAAILRVLKPGAHLLAFGGTRTYHRMVCAIEDAGFEIRDQIGWVYGSGFPKSRNIGGGWGTALKPAWEPICVARKPLVGTVAANVLVHGTGALNIDGCRVAFASDDDRDAAFPAGKTTSGALAGPGAAQSVNRREFVADALGRWPANLVHDGSDEVLAGFPRAPGQIAKAAEGGDRRKDRHVYGVMRRGPNGAAPRDDSGSAARFFYCAKATKRERGEGNNHPTVKPVALMRWLCRLVTPPGGHVLDPFAGSGTTGLAAQQEGFQATMIEANPEYAEVIRARLGIDNGPTLERFVAALCG